MTIDEFVERSPRTEVGPDSANGEAVASAALLPQAGDPGGRGGGQGQRGRGGRRGEPEDQADNPADIDLGNPLSRLGDTLLMILLFIVAIVVSIALAGRFGARREEEAGETAALAAEDAEAMLRASLGAFDYDGDDPRLQITAAYHRLLVALADAGAPREPQEAPHEYLYRALGPLGVRPAPMHRLTELYVIAQFSELPITTDHRADAIAALEEGLRDLHARTGAGDGEAAALT
jgi:hypothetical protein